MTTFSATLPMYDLPELRDATEGFWDDLRTEARRRGLAAPDRLDGDGERLFFGQVCGIEVARQQPFPRRIVGAPAYDLPGCEGSTHRAFLVTHADDDRPLADLRGARAAINEWGSNTGANLFARTIGEPLRDYFGEVLVTGAHRESMDAVRRGEADVASIDCVTFGLLRRHTDETEGVRILVPTRRVPAPPFVTDLGDERAAVLRDAMTTTLAQSSHAATLGLRGVERRVVEDYDVIL